MLVAGLHRVRNGVRQRVGFRVGEQQDVLAVDRVRRQRPGIDSPRTGHAVHHPGFVVVDRRDLPRVPGQPALQARLEAHHLAADGSAAAYVGQRNAREGSVETATARDPVGIEILEAVVLGERVLVRAVPAQYVGVQHADVVDPVGLDQAQAVPTGVDRVVDQSGLDPVHVHVPDEHAARRQEVVVGAGIAPDATILAGEIENDAGILVPLERQAGEGHRVDLPGFGVGHLGHPAVLQQEEFPRRGPDLQGLRKVAPQAVDAVVVEIVVCPTLSRDPHRIQAVGIGSTVQLVQIQPAQVPLVPGAQRRRQDADRDDVGRIAPGGNVAHRHRQVRPRVHQVPDARVRRPILRVVHVHQAQRVPELVVQARGDTARIVVLVRRLGNDRDLAQYPGRSRFRIDALQGHRLAQRHEECGNVVRRVVVHVALPVAARMDEDHVRELVVVVEIRQVRRAVRPRAGVRRPDHVLHQALQVVQMSRNPGIVGSRSVVRDIGQVVATLRGARQHVTLDDQPSTRLDLVELRKPFQMRQEIGAIVRRRIDLDRTGIRQGIQHETAAGRDGRQILVAVRIERDAHDQHLQRVRILGRRARGLQSGVRALEQCRAQPALFQQGLTLPRNEAATDHVVHGVPAARGFTLPRQLAIDALGPVGQLEHVFQAATPDR